MIIYVCILIYYTHNGRGWYVYGGDSPGRDMVGYMAEYNTVRQGSGQVFPQRHLAGGMVSYSGAIISSYISYVRIYGRLVQFLDVFVCLSDSYQNC